MPVECPNSCGEITAREEVGVFLFPRLKMFQNMRIKIALLLGRVQNNNA